MYTHDAFRAGWALMTCKLDADIAVPYKIQSYSPNDAECGIPAIHIRPGPICWLLLIPSQNTGQCSVKIYKLGILAIDDRLLCNCVAWCRLRHSCCILG